MKISPHRMLLACAAILCAPTAIASTPLPDPAVAPLNKHQETTSPSPSNLPIIEHPDPATLELARVVRILDGDTLLLSAGGKTRRYQLLASDAPEFVPNDHTPAPFSIEARRFIEQLLLNEQVYIQYDPLAQRDHANRLRAYLFRAPDMLFVNLELVRQGYAQYNTAGMSLYQSAFKSYANRAQQLQRGIWNPHPDLIQPDDDEESQPEKNQASQDQQSTTKSTPPNNSSTTVYITKFGKKYHTKDCPHLTDTQHEVTRKDIDDSYEPCKTCKPDE